MLRPTLILTALLLMASSAQAKETSYCFQVSNNDTWSRTPELLCLNSADDKTFELTLKTGIPPVDVGKLHLELLSRVRCIDCNADVFGLSNPSNSAWNALKVTFDGKRDMKTGVESGTVKIGDTSFHYRSTPKAGATPPPATPASQPSK